MLNTNPPATPEAKKPRKDAAVENADAVKTLVQVVTKAMTTDNIDDMVACFAADSEWVIVATGETFKGLDDIRTLATRSVAARTHSNGLGIKPFNVFTNPEGTRLCWEYIHTGVVGEKWPSTSAQRPASGTKFELPIMLSCEIRDGKLIKIREYFDLLTLTDPGTKHKLYS
jgi:ketosteroid isomerase-like protein